MQAMGGPCFLGQTIMFFINAFSDTNEGVSQDRRIKVQNKILDTLS